MSNPNFHVGQTVRIKENGDTSNESHIPPESIKGKIGTISAVNVAGHGSGPVGPGFESAIQYMKHRLMVHGESHEVYENWLEAVE